MLNLVRHDLLIVRNSFMTAFSSARDWLILAIGLVLVAVWARQWLIDLAAAGPAVPLWAPAALFLVAGYSSFLFSAHRLSHMAEESPLAPFALRPGPRRTYQGLALAGVLAAGCVPLAFVYGSTGERVFGLALVGGWLPLLAGAAAGAVWRSAALRVQRELQRRWLRRAALTAEPRPLPAGRASGLLAMALRRQSLLARSTGEAIAIIAGAGAAVALTAFVLRRTASDAAALGVTALLSLAIMLVLSRLSARLARYLAFAGFSPLVPGLAPVPGMALFLGSLTLATAVLTPRWALPAAVLAAGALILFGIVAYMRALHYRIRSERAADVAIQVEAIAAAMLGFGFLPLAALFILGRVAWLHRRARDATWALP